jgi:hypothetical protein
VGVFFFSTRHVKRFYVSSMVQTDCLDFLEL